MIDKVIGQCKEAHQQIENLKINMLSGSAATTAV